MTNHPTSDVPQEIASLIEAVKAARARYRAGDPHLVFPLERLADAYAARGEFRQAKPFLQEAVTIRVQTWGAKHPELAGALNLLATIMESERKFKKVDEYLQQATKCLMQANPPRPVTLAETWNHWAELLFRRGDAARALPHCQNALATLKGRERAYPTLVLRIQNNLGVMHLTLGDVSSARREFFRNLRLAKSVYSPSNSALITYYSNLAEACRRRHDYPRADRFLRHALSIARTNGGWKHPLTAAIAANLAAVWSLAGRWTAATKLYDRVYRIRRKIFSLSDTEVVKSALNVAELQCLQHNWLEAEKLLDEFLNSLESSEQLAPATRALLRTRLARIYLSTGRLASAERWLTEAWNEAQVQANEFPLLLADIALALGVVYAQRKAAEKAEDYFHQALTRQEASLGTEHVDLAKTLVERGRLERDQSALAAAWTFFYRALTLRRKFLGKRHPLTAATMLELAEIRCEQQKWSAAQKLGYRAKAVLDQATEAIPWINAAADGLLSRTAFELEEFHTAEQFAQSELSVRQQLVGPDHGDLGPVLLRLGRLQRMSDRIDDAVETLKRGLTITEKARGQYDPDVIPFLQELCSLRATDGPTTELEPLLERFLKCHQRTFGNQSEELGQAQDQAAEWWRAAGDEARAMELNERANSIRELSMHVFGELM